MVEKYLNIDLNDENAAKIAEIISNKTCKKILNLIAEEELSESDIASKLKIPLNTVDYNIKKLLAAGLVEKTRNFFWSVKGKKIESYRLANKKIIISTRSKFRGILPAMLISGIVAVGIKQFINYFNSKEVVNNLYAGSSDFAIEKSVSLVSPSASSMNVVNDSILRVSEGASSGFFSMLFNNNPIWAWFLFGALFGIVVVWLWNSKITSERRLK